MRLYRTSDGRWHGTQAEGSKHVRKEGLGTFDWVNVPTDKQGLLDYLNKLNAEARRAADDSAPRFDPAPRGAPMTEDAFEALPLAQQLHLAALALETARERIRD